MGIKNFLKMLYEKLQSNNTIDIIILYINLIFYKIIPILIPLSLIGYSNVFVNVFRYIITAYLIINLLISDFILRQSVKIRNPIDTDNACEKCSSNIVWNLQDNISNIVFYILGGIIFKYNIYLDIYWRSYMHSLPICIKNKLCIHKSVEIQYVSIPFGIFNYLIEFALHYVLPAEYTLIIMFFVIFVIDCIIFNLNVKYKNNLSFTNILLIYVLKIYKYLNIVFI